MTVYLDTSALVKRFIREDHSPLVIDLLSDEPRVASSVVLLAEAPAAFAKARRTGTINAVGEQTANTAFRASRVGMAIVPITVELAAEAGARASVHNLRAYDAVHLTSALFLRFSALSDVTFATFDRALWRAARDEGLDPWPPGWGD